MSSVAPFRRTAWLSFTVFSAWARRRVFGSTDRSGADRTLDRADSGETLPESANHANAREKRIPQNHSFAFIRVYSWLRFAGAQRTKSAFRSNSYRAAPSTNSARGFECVVGFFTSEHLSSSLAFGFEITGVRVSEPYNLWCEKES
jgi:hypothetical protein